MGPSIALVSFDFVDGSLLTGIGTVFGWVIYHTLVGRRWRKENEDLPETVEQIEKRQERLIRDLRGADDDSTHHGHFAETEQSLARLERDMTELRGEVDAISSQVNRLCNALQTHPDFEHLESKHRDDD